VKRFERELVRGWLHEPDSPSGDSLALTHGAGSNCEAPLLKKLAEVFAAAGVCVLRFDLPYRQLRPHGPPFPAQAARDRESLKQAALALRELSSQRVFFAGSSYGGRQSTMAAAENPGLVDALLLLSYPLHAPGKPERPRTEHFPDLHTPALFVHGTRDSFGTIEELRTALQLIPAHTELEVVPGAPHGLPPATAASIPARFVQFLSTTR
jgi:uncharacterized protein